MSVFDTENKKTEHALVKKAKIMAKRDKRVFEFNTTVLGVYGWQMSIPMLLGILVGKWLDKNLPASHFSWTFNLIIIGAALGFYNANQWIKKETGLKLNRQSKKEEKK